MDLWPKLERILARDMALGTFAGFAALFLALVRYLLSDSPAPGEGQLALAAFSLFEMFMALPSAGMLPGRCGAMVLTVVKSRSGEGVYALSPLPGPFHW